MTQKLSPAKKLLITHAFQMLREHPEAWVINEYNATYGNVSIWMGNRYYATHIVGHGIKVGGNEDDKEPFYQRGWRKQIVDLAEQVAAKQLEAKLTK